MFKKYGKKNRRFVAFQLVSINETHSVEYFNVISNFLWLYSVDAFIYIRKSTIIFGNINAGETPKNFVGPEMVFCKDHNFIMYLKGITETRESKPENDHFSEFETENDDADDLSDVENLPPHSG